MDPVTFGAAVSVAKGALTDPTIVNAAVSDWLDDHPEATTTVEDGAISYAKLNSSLQGTVDDVGKLKSDVDDFSETVEGKNKYNPAACSPEDGKLYDGTTGAIKAGASYAATGKIPVEENTQYTFSATTKAAEYARPYFYSGSSGGTYLSRGDQGGTTFTTPVGCTFVAFNLFGRSHTTEDYNAAIAAAMLEIGAVATAYEPYFIKQMVVPSGIEGGSAIGAFQAVTGASSPVNMFDKSLAVDGKYINSGSVVTLADWAYTGKIPVKPNTQYNISKDPTAPLDLKTSVQQWGTDGSYISSITTTGGYSYLVPFVTGANTYYVSVNMSKTSHTSQDFNDTIDTIMLCYGTQRPLTYSAYNKQPNVLSDKMDNAYFNPDVFSGKKWLACGTSITWYDSKAYLYGLNAGAICRGYVGNVARRKGLLVTNEGISGSCLAGSGDSALINRYTTLDWANADIATIEYGVNDFGNAIPIGTAEDAAGTDTFAACLKTIIEYALGQNPKLCLVICTDPDVRGSTANNDGHYLYEYMDVMLAIAKQYRLPVCDWFYHSGINAVTKGSSSVDYLTADGTHPNDAGHLRMGAMLNQVFNSLIC